jgi:hypothetical protein
MTTVIFVIVAVLAVFVVALVSPNHGTRLQRYTDRVAGGIDGWLRGKPSFVRKLLGKPTSVSSKAVKNSAKAGKKANRKMQS